MLIRENAIIQTSIDTIIPKFIYALCIIYRKKPKKRTRYLTIYSKISSKVDK